MITRFPIDEIALKIAVAVGLGMLVGLEREWANKDIGVRTFSLAAMLGMLGGLLGLGCQRPCPGIPVARFRQRTHHAHRTA